MAARGSTGWWHRRGGGAGGLEPPSPPHFRDKDILRDSLYSDKINVYYTSENFL